MFLFATSIPAIVERFDGPTHAELVGPDMLTTQIMIKPGGDWHRRGPADEETACGLYYNACAERNYIAHVPHLCEDCFTKHERTLALAIVK